MALTFNFSSTGKMDLSEYLEFIRTEVDPNCRESVLASAEKLYALSLNKQLLLETIHQDLVHEQQGKDSRFYSSHSFVLGSAKGLTVRANIWPVTTAFRNKPHRHAHVNKVYAYEYPHDHNFDFLTVGWYGPGYVTDIYEYDYSSVAGFDGENVNMKFLERTSLSEGKVMFFREGEDIHIQYPPPALSVSLNLLVRTPNTAVREQLLFDIENGRISSMATGSDVARTILAIDFCRIVGDSETVSILSGLAEQSKSGRVRAAALHAMAELEPSSLGEIGRIGKNDPSPHVKRVLNNFAA